MRYAECLSPVEFEKLLFKKAAGRLQKPERIIWE